MADRRVQTVHNICGLACILELTGSNNQVSLTIKERSLSAQWNGAPLGKTVRVSVSSKQCSSRLNIVTETLFCQCALG